MAKKNITIRVREFCSGDFWDVMLCNGSKKLMENYERVWSEKYYAIRAAKKLAEKIGIPYNDKILKEHGC